MNMGIKSARTVISNGVIALTLIALPMSVFAQLADDTEQTDLEIQTETAEIEVVEPVVTTPQHYDTYKREDLPASGSDTGDFVVGPGRYSLEISPGESKTVLLNISNRLGEKRLFRLTTEDMTSSDNPENSVIQLLGDSVGPYTIKDYITVEHDSFYLESNKRVVVPVTISLPADAEPGGFYGSILTEVMPLLDQDSDSDVAPAAALVSRIGTLFYVTTPGDIERSGELIGFSTIPDKLFYLDSPIDMGLVFENTGSVHLTPFGTVTVSNIIGETVGQVDILPWFVMPNSVRTREISWDREFLIGRYTVTAEMDRGYDSVLDTKTIVFWVFPWKLIAPLFAGVFLFFLAIRFIARNFEFKRK